MTRIVSGTQPTQPAKRAPKVAPKAAATGPVRAATGGFKQLVGQAVNLQGRLAQAVAAKQFGVARQLQAELRPVVKAMQQAGGADPVRQALVGRVGAAMQAVDRQLAPAPRPAALPKASLAQTGPTAPAPRPGTGKPVAPAPQTHGGPLGGVGKAVNKLGSGLEKAGHVVFFPLEAIGKVTDPARSWIGEKLGKLKKTIDESPVGKAPVIGPATRFTTGLASSLVGMVDGAVQAVTHPVDLIKGVGSIAGTVVGLIPGPKQAWDAAVHGKDFKTSYKEGLTNAKNLGKAFIQPALDDFAAGNYAGGVGRLVGDIGSVVLTTGAAGGAKVGQVGVVAGRAGRFGKLGAAAKAGAKVITAVDDFSAKIITAGMKANLSPLAKAGKVVADVLPMRQVAGLADEAAQLTAAPAAVAKKAKAAHTFAADALAGEIRMANAPDVAAAVAAQQDVLGRMGGVPVWEHLSDKVLGAMVDHEPKLVAAMKELKLNGKAVTSLEEAAEAWRALPENAPQRLAVAKKLAGAVQEGFAEGLQFPPAAVEFSALPDNLAGLQKDAKVLLDPSLLNEDLRYLVDVMAEEQTHAYQRFLTDNKDALKLEPKMAAEVEKYAKEFQVEHYLNPPAAGLEVLAGGMDELNRVMKDLKDHADENVVMQLRRQAAPKLAAGTPERAVLDAWWAKAGPESERLSFMKFALEDLNKKGVTKTGLTTWIGDYQGRLPDGITHADGMVARTADDARAMLEKAIKESQTTLGQAHREVSDVFKKWTDAYKSQSLEFTARAVAADVGKWMFGD